MRTHRFPSNDVGPVVRGVLRSARRQLGLPVVYLTQIVGQRSIIRALVGDADAFGLAEGAESSLNTTIDLKVLSGRLPNVVADTRLDPRARQLLKRIPPVHAMAAVPVREADGTLYGTLTGLAAEPQPTLSSQSWHVLAVLADVISDHLQVHIDANESIRHLLRAVGGEDFETVFQPIVDLTSGELAGLEALTRFVDGRPVPLWLSEAGHHGLADQLEDRLLRSALRQLDQLPAQAYLSVNASPAMVVNGRLRQAMDTVDQPERIVVELTEHAAVDDYAELTAALQPIRDRGVRLAIDDAGAGFASLRHVLELTPETVKLDASLTRDVPDDRHSGSLCAALCRFAEETSTSVTAEGIETVPALTALRALGVRYGQGYLIGAPGRIDDLRERYPV